MSPRGWMMVQTLVVFLALSEVQAFVGVVNNHIANGALLPMTTRTPQIQPQKPPPSNVALGLSPVGSAIGHVLGGNLGTPIVFRAIKLWYLKIPKPTWTPPNRVFGPTWTFLYASQGVALARVASRQQCNSWLLQAWAAHYLLGLTWAPTFFGFVKFRLALVTNVLLSLSGWMLVWKYAAVDAIASALLVPYAIWLVFATFLNVAICQLNPYTQGYNNAMFERDLAQLQKKAAENIGL